MPHLALTVPYKCPRAELLDLSRWPLLIGHPNTLPGPLRPPPVNLGPAWPRRRCLSVPGRMGHGEGRSINSSASYRGRWKPGLGGRLLSPIPPSRKADKTQGPS